VKEGELVFPSPRLARSRSDKSSAVSVEVEVGALRATKLITSSERNDGFGSSSVAFASGRFVCEVAQDEPVLKMSQFNGPDSCLKSANWWAC
jgi:hypothetical protein